MTALGVALDKLITTYRDTFPRLSVCFDAAWRSPCELGQPYQGTAGEERIEWAPLRQAVGDYLRQQIEGLANALEQEIHPDIVSYYGRYWGSSLECSAQEGHVSLILLWNKDDIDRLVENLIGHALSQRRSNSPFSIFVANTEVDSDYFLSVQNDSGKVVLERPGRQPLQEVAPSLAAFLTRLSPAASPQSRLY